MGNRRSVVITGASRGLGFASAMHLYRLGWQVVGAMRCPVEGFQKIRECVGAPVDDPRLIGVQLDLADPELVRAAARSIESVIGAPDVLVHNAGVAASGCVEETPDAVWHQVFATNFFGPVMFSKALLPAMRDYGDHSGPYAAHYAGIRRTGGAMSQKANPPEVFARALAKAMDEQGPFARQTVGSDAGMLAVTARLLSGRALHDVARRTLGLPLFGALRGCADKHAVTENSSSKESKQYG